MRIIINADDYGKDLNTSKAIVDAFSMGLCSSTTIMTTGDSFEESIELARTHYISNKIGIHLNLIEGSPLTNPIRKFGRFCNKEGEFNRHFRNVPVRFSCSNAEKAVIAIELRAQIEKCIKLGIKITHADSHQNVHMRWELWSIINPILKEFNITKVRISRNCGQSISFAKLIYKYLYNRQIALRGYKTSDYFGGVNDVTYLVSKNPHIRNIDKIIEVMVHPTYQVGTRNLLDTDVKLLDAVQSIPGWERAITYSEL